MKYEHIRQWFNLKVRGAQRTVRPYNAEITKKHRQDLGWSQGFTSFEIKETGTTGWCGQDWFEQHAKPVKLKI